MTVYAPTTVAQVVSAAGGQIIGRTRLQRTFYFLTVAGIETSFPFDLTPHGPYSEELDRATAIARMQGSIQEDEQPAGWGGKYAIFTARDTQPRELPDPARELLRLTTAADVRELQLAASVVYFAQHGARSPWEESVRRQPELTAWLPGAHELLHALHQLPLPAPIPDPSSE